MSLPFGLSRVRDASGVSDIGAPERDLNSVRTAATNLNISSILVQLVDGIGAPPPPR